jgi:hypothetical protein
VEYDGTGAVTGLYFEKFDMSLDDVVKQSRSFDEEVHGGSETGD